ncbi:hypothetical protein [Paenibacillus mesotrionivorans]|uniref:Uncharacterized protein n=1 Tax=Paenibacillus mesotrionivorans TaxID=3160968 RepID=A0ACC7NXZ8_9BACL
MHNELQDEERELLQASLLGDVREDIQFLGLTLPDIGWIVAVTLIVGGIPFFLPLFFLIKMAWIIGVFLVYTGARYLDVPYRIRRLYRYWTSASKGSGEQLPELLGAQEDSWLFKSGSVWQMVLHVQPPPWHTAELAKKRNRIGALEAFIRTAVREHFSVDVDTHLVPDYQWELWNAKRSKPKATEGIERLSQRRLRLYESSANLQKDTPERPQAKRTVYVLRLSIEEYRLSLQERDDEPEGATKEELRRYRLLADLRERKNRVLPILEHSGLKCQMLSGYAAAQVLGRQWDAIAWREWQSSQGQWTDEENPQTVEEAEPISIQPVQEKKLSFWQRFITFIRREWHALWTKVQTAAVKRKARSCNKKEVPQENEDKSGQVLALEDKALQLEESYCEEKGPDMPQVLILTSPVPSGKTFLAANWSVAQSTAEHPVALMDLAPDHGTLTVLNPLQGPTEEGWTLYTSRWVPGLSIWVPTQEACGIQSVQDKLQELLQSSAQVVIDLPWLYPWREELKVFGQMVAVLDADYHHWTQWERAATAWSEPVWLNKAEVDMDVLVRDHWDAAISKRFPVFPGAAQRLFQGKPIALEPDVRQHFLGRSVS